jgi:very-short-patch-repair endonuclease
MNDAISRRETVERARGLWIDRLVDRSRRNNLLFFRELRAGTLGFSPDYSDALQSLVDGEFVPLAELRPHADLVTLPPRLREIGRRALANLEEKGLETLFVALGSATWPATDGGRPYEAPVLLIPVRIESQGRDGRVLGLRPTGDVQVNDVLLHELYTGFGYDISRDALLSPQDDDEDAPLIYLDAFQSLKASVDLPEFAVLPRAVLGNFSYQKMAMVNDLRDRAEELAASDMIAAIAGDLSARQALRRHRAEIDPRDLDLVPPDQEFLVLDADASQQRVVTAVLQMQDGVIQGPPGTGKSQTIANIITSLAAHGRRVLFVAEKRAALEVVLRRLQDAGLGHFALDLHGAEISRSQVMSHLRESLTLVHESQPVRDNALHQQVAADRARLNEHAARMHLPRHPSGLSAFTLQSRLLGLRPDATTTVRWRGSSLDSLGAAVAAEAHDLLIEAGGFSGLFLGTDASPWTGARLVDGAAVQTAQDLVAGLAHQRWPAARLSLASAGNLVNFAPGTLTEALHLVALCTEVAGTLALYDAGVYDLDLEELVASLQPAGRGAFARLWAALADGRFRAARRSLLSLRREGGVSGRQLLDEAIRIAAQRQAWAALIPAAVRPFAVADIHNMHAVLEAVQADIATLGVILGRADLAGLPLDTLERLLSALASDTVTPYRLPRLIEIEATLLRYGLGDLIADLRARRVPPELWRSIFDRAWLSSCLDRARQEDPALAAFNGRTHDRTVESFRVLDRERLHLAAERVRREHAERVIAAMNAYPDQENLVRNEANKRTRHRSLRAMLAQAPDVLTALRPCWMVSPLSVSQLLPADRQYFDFVLFDEASQVLPEDAIPAILRAAHAVVAGDEHQLPPTRFFADGGDGDGEDSDDPSPTAGFESLLKIMSPFLPPWWLEWHYRSRDEQLIAFSNRHIYGDRLLTLPGAGSTPSVNHIHVPQPAGLDGQQDSVGAEVERVVDLIISHAERTPHETLGVIAMGIKHADRVQAALDKALLLRADLQHFFDERRSERFFIKNLERVQGDERDAIILTVGYGKDASGRLPYRFGPLLYEGGERRLNVAVTRARLRMTVVSSFTHHDMDPSRSSARGVELLRLYLEYAASQGRSLGQAARTVVPMNAFEQDIHDALVARGLQLQPQWGVGRYRIDLAVQHPTEPGRFLLAIECDGASYHSSPTARDRDRLRQQELEKLGWRFHRIWSTDWFQQREQEIERAVIAYTDAIAYADDTDRRDVRQPDRVPTESQQRRDPAPGEAAATTLRRRAPRPMVPRRESITEYSRAELVSLVDWICSDGLLRTHDQIIDEMVDALGFKRRGARIEARIREAIAASQHRSA